MLLTGRADEVERAIIAFMLNGCLLMVKLTLGAGIHKSRATFASSVGADMHASYSA